MCYGGVDAKHVMRETEGRLAGLPKVSFTKLSVDHPNGLFVHLNAVRRKCSTRGALALVSLMLSGCTIGAADRWPPEQHQLTFTFNGTPGGTECDATATGVVTKSRDILGAPRVRIDGYAETTVITCTLPGGQKYMGLFAAGLPFGSSRAFDVSSVYNAGSQGLPVRVRSGDIVGTLGNGLVRVQ
jgi:hypothetical protein